MKLLAENHRLGWASAMPAKVGADRGPVLDDPRPSSSRSRAAAQGVWRPADRLAASWHRSGGRRSVHRARSVMYTPPKMTRPEMTSASVTCSWRMRIPKTMASNGCRYEKAARCEASMRASA